MQLLSGNEAIAQGAWEAGCTIGVGYPGTPSTETMETFAKKDGVYAEWCPNEKVALEVGIGASAAGARVLATMKHVGVNVAADPLFTAAYTGVGGGLVLLAADDPGMHSSQNEQDSRYYALAAHVPVFEPANSQEALDMAKAAFGLSEQFDLPCMIRSTVRISHAKTPVDTGTQTSIQKTDYEKNPGKWVMMPAYAKQRRKDLDTRIAEVKQWVETTDFIQEHHNSSEIGIVCSGAVYQYVLDAMPDASVLKLGVSWPLPEKRIADFAKSVSKLYCIDEASSYLSDQIRAAGISLGPLLHPLPYDGELSPALVAQSFGIDAAEHEAMPSDVPNRPPALCAGCPHRLVFRELARARCIVTGDIGCYTLGALPPLAAMDTCVCMGASISMAHGFELGFGEKEHQPVVAVIGDSTFGHSGITSLLNTVYNTGSGTVCILDNRTTGMTGHQGNPINGITLQERDSREMDLTALVRALGVEDVTLVNPNIRDDVRNAIKQATQATETLSVIIFRSPCVLLRDSFERRDPFFVGGNCVACGQCIALGCPAISMDEDGHASIDTSSCVGCGQCAQYCGTNAIEQLKGVISHA